MYDDSFKLRYNKAPIAINTNNSAVDTKPHIHNEIEIIYIVKGETSVKIGPDSFIANEGDFIFVNPLEVHSLKTNLKKPYLHQCICFDCSLIADKRISDGILNGYISIPHLISTSDDMINSFLKLYDAVTENTEALLLESTAYISIVFAELVKRSLLIENRPKEKSVRFCSKVMKYITEHYGEEVSSNDVAKEFFYTQSYFCRNFNKNFGTSFSAFLNIYRVLKAKELLEDDNAKISEIAVSCGFGTSNYFSKCFKKYVGMSPSEYQKCQYSPQN